MTFIVYNLFLELIMNDCDVQHGHVDILLVSLFSITGLVLSRLATMNAGTVVHSRKSVDTLERYNVKCQLYNCPFYKHHILRNIYIYIYIYIYTKNKLHY